MKFSNESIIALLYFFFLLFLKGFEILICKPGDVKNNNKINIPFKPSKIKFKYSKKGEISRKDCNLLNLLIIPIGDIIK
jgi:hypothetical protein